MTRNAFYMLLMVVVFFSLAGVISYRHFDTVDAQHEKKLDLDRIQLDYFQKVGWIRSNPDDKMYGQEVRSFLSAYFAEVEKHAQKFHLNKEFNDYLSELVQDTGKDVEKKLNARGEFGQRMAAEIEKKASSVGDRREAFDFTKKVFDTFRSGAYHPVFTGADKGLRMDVMSSELSIVNGKPKIHLTIVVWGAARDIVEVQGVKHIQANVNLSSKWSLYDTKNKLYGEETSNGFSKLITTPERLIWAFPPQVVVGSFDMEQVPAEADHMEITFNVSSHYSTGGQADATLVWKQPVPAEWKLKAGEKWEGATEQMRSEDEINGKGKSQAAK